MSRRSPTRVNVPPGCTFDTNTGSATGVLDLALNMTAISYGWLMDPDQLLGDLDLPRYKELVTIAQWRCCNAGSLQNTEVKQDLLWLVLGWVTIQGC